MQLVIGLIYGFPYRVVDINDALLNFAGVMAGYAALKMCARVYRRLVGTAETSDGLFGHINTVLLSA